MLSLSKSLEHYIVGLPIEICSYISGTNALVIELIEKSVVDPQVGPHEDLLRGLTPAALQAHVPLVLDRGLWVDPMKD